MRALRPREAARPRALARLRRHDRGASSTAIADTFRDPRVWRRDGGEWVQGQHLGRPRASLRRARNPGALRAASSARRACSRPRRRRSPATRAAACASGRVRRGPVPRVRARRAASRRSEKYGLLVRRVPGLRDALHDARGPRPTMMAALLRDSRELRATGREHIFPASEAARREKIHRPWLERVAGAVRGARRAPGDAGRGRAGVRHVRRARRAGGLRARGRRRADAGAGRGVPRARGRDRRAARSRTWPTSSPPRRRGVPRSR